ncbi:hypothetical protein [Bacteroides congonensis]|uniref:hypothetical protein n=1 Tax=Bacteroides congonensis TaxID=1871006 RepID=UPI000935289B|nr:hypothetical protein [Bacteroides congonensis]
MKRKTIIRFGVFVMSLLLLAMPINAEDEIPPFIPTSTHDPDVQSPQLAAIKRHDNLPVELNTGGISLEIPLVNWKDRDFECPVSLSYSSAGFRPREQDNYVGRNWMLNVGGVVYRKVNGVPDDLNWGLIPIAGDAGPSNYQYANGFLYMLNMHKFNRDEMLQNYRTNPYKYAAYKDSLSCMPSIPGTNSVEASADVFHFSFGKYSGKFMINFDGSVSVSGNNGGKYKVDLSEMAIFDSTTPRETRIRIMTDDGYIYTFGGGGYSSLEYNALAWKNHISSVNIQPQFSRNEISAYYLTEIQAPNGRKLIIKYRDDINEDYHKHPEMLSTLYNKPVAEIGSMALQYSLSGMSKSQAYRSATSSFDENPAFKPEPLRSYALTKVALIDRIVTTDCEILFTYSARGKYTDYGSEVAEQGSFPYICGAKLDEVTLSCRSYSEKALLSYTYEFGNRMFLRSVKNKEGRYDFQYKVGGIASVPTPLSYNIDHWGFWRGLQTNSGIIPRMKPGTLYAQDYIITSNDRDATGECYDYTLLQQMTYPTGGYTRFEYEPHRYSLFPQPSYNSHYYLKPEYPVGVHDAPAGGARVKSVTHYEQDKAVKKTIYTYGYIAYMGELTYMPYYRYLAYFINDKGENLIKYISFDSEGITDVPYPSVHIRYPEVTEHYVAPTAKDLSAKHPYKTTEFVHNLASTYNYQGDFSYATAPNVFPLDPDKTFKYEDIKQYNRNLLAHPTVDVSLKYGKVQKESFYNDEKKLVARTEYEYSYLNKDKCALRIYTAAPHFGLRTGLYSHIINEPFYEYALVKKTTSRYMPENDREALRTPEWYEYDKDGYLCRHSALRSEGDSLVENYTRIQRNAGYGIQVLPAGHSLRMADADKDVLLKRDTVCYTLCQSADGSSVWHMPQFVTSFDGNGKTQNVKELLHRDVYGNPTEIVTNHSERVIYLWGYYGKYPVAQIKNATYSEVGSALGKSPASVSQAFSCDSSLSGLQARLPKAQVTTYIYHPYAGIKSETTPDGKTTYYDYDAKGRLVKSYRTGENGKQEILQLANYHIINE